MDRKERIQRILLGSSLTVGLIALGLSVTGTSAKALTWIAPGSAGGFVIPQGSSQRTERVTLNGRQSTVKLCYHPGRTPASVLDYYAKLADREKALGTPYLAMPSGQGGGSLLWVTPEGTRKGVVATPDPKGGTRFRLLSEDGVRPTAGQPRPASAVRVDVLPGGIDPSLGLDVRFCLTRPDGTGSAVLEGPGGARDVAARVMGALEAAGFRAAKAERAALRSGASDETHVILPFEHGSGALAGHLSVTPTPEGARASLSVRAARR